ncbi:MAG TPA: hypothetical protein DD827_09775 [Gammaproteobacteria bacterium]|nr:hypothetical protein [Gammaproteobacteria bacterium]
MGRKAKYDFYDDRLNSRTTLVNNIPSRKVAENTGAKYEGILQNRLAINGKPVDACMFSLIK